MKNTYWEKICNIFVKTAQLKNYVFANLLSVSGYLYLFFLQKLANKAAVIYSEPGADTTTEGIMHTFEHINTLVNFSIIWFVLTILVIIEYVLKRKFLNKNLNGVKKIPISIEVIHSIVFFIGLWVPLSRFLIAIIFLILYPISELFSSLS